MTDEDFEAIGGLVLLGMLAVGFLWAVIYGLREAYGGWRTDKVRKLAKSLGFTLGAKHLKGTWNGFPVEVSVRPSIERYILVGGTRGATWLDVYDRKAAEELVDAGAAFSTGDAAFDGKYAVRARDPRKAEGTLAGDARGHILDAGPEWVEFKAGGVVYTFGGDDVTGPKLRRHLDAATALAKAAGGAA